MTSDEIAAVDAYRETLIVYAAHCWDRLAREDRQRAEPAPRLSRPPAKDA